MKVIILLKEIREQKQISLEQLSKISGISKSHLNYIERQEQRAYANSFNKNSKSTKYRYKRFI